MSTVISDLQIGSSGAMVVAATSTQGIANRLSIESPTSTGSAEIQVVPGTSVDQSAMNSQIIFFGKTGTDYERFSISEINHETRIDNTADHNGAIRNVVFIMGGYEHYQSTGKVRTGQNALILVSDASVRLRGSLQTVASSGSEAGGTFGAERTTIYDFGDTGTSRLVIGTRQANPNTALYDEASVEYARSNSSKWRVGLNASGGDADSFEWYSGEARMSLNTSGDLRVERDATVVRNLGVGVAPVYPFHAQTAVSGDAIAKIYNSASDGYGFVLRNGDNSRYAMTIQNADASANVIQFFGSGNITCVSLTQTSDARFKKNIKTMENVLPLVRKLRAVTFQWAEKQIEQGWGKSGAEHIGVVAQEVETVFPDLVRSNEHGTRSVDFAKLCVVLLEAVKELDARVNTVAVA